ncbi:MAG: hypothetical protein H6506_00695 [Calditrichaeota bacterium]|nr:hypothetical protein [Calditrichota bacterium]MCB9391154.1 hypothetical protein [Calditrichota bacterium]
MRMIVRVFLLTILSIALAVSAGAALRIGDPIEYELSLPPSDSVQVLPPSGLPLRVLPIRPDQTAQKGGVFRFQAALYDTGEFVIPPMRVALFRNGQIVDTLRTEERTARVESMLADTASSPSPIKPYREHPLYVKDVFRAFWPWVLAATLVASLIALILWWKRWRVVADSEPVVPVLPPAELAIRELNALAEKKYPDRGMLKEHFSEFSEIMRKYVEGSYGFSALEMTTFELGREFGREDLPGCWKNELLPLLRDADLVKFAKEIPTLDASRAILETGFRLIAETRPRIETSNETQAA